MELALSLGDTSKPFSIKFLDKAPKLSSKDLGFCTALGGAATGTATANGFSTTTRSQEDRGDHRYHEDERRRPVLSDPPLQLDLLPFSPVNPRRQQHPPSKNIRFPWLAENLMSEPGSIERPGRGFDVNRLSVEDVEEGAALSSPNSAASSFQLDFGVRGGRGSKRDLEAMDTERASSRASDDEENALTRKKLRLSKEQSAFLEESFKEHTTLNPKQKLALAKQLNLRPRQVEVWFQNRRARTKLKQTEVDCEYLKRCCETLTEENRRLQKELQELRALKTSHPFYMQLPATTLTMCPSCERVATTTTSSSGTTTTTITNDPGVVTVASTTSTTNSKALSVKPLLFPLSHGQAHIPQLQSHQAAS